MYNGGTPIAGGSVVLAVTGGNGMLLPLVIASAAVVLGALMLLRQHWLKSKTD